MSDPRLSALICAAVAAWLGYTIFFGAETSNTFLVVVQWTFLLVAVAGLATALARIVKRNRP